MYNNDINYNFNNIITSRKTPKYAPYNNNIKFTNSEKNIKTEPKDLIKKQFSFNNRIKKNSTLNNNVKLNTEFNTRVDYNKDIKKRCKSNKIMKSRTINTEVQIDKKNKKVKYEGVSNDFIKKFGTKYNSNNIDEMLLYMFIKQKNPGKNNNQNSFRK